MNQSMLDAILEDVGDPAEQELLRETWNRLEPLERVDPSPELERNFARTIAFSRAVAPRSSSLRRRLVPLAAALVVGVAIGSLVASLPFASRGDGDRDRFSRAVAVIFESRPLASRRIEAIQTLAGFTGDPQVGRILAEVVNTDPSIDVRLCAIDAIGPHVANEEVPRRLIQAVRSTDSTLVQIRLIELFVDHQIAAALPEIGSLNRDPDVDELVRESVQWATNRL